MAPNAGLLPTLCGDRGEESTAAGAAFRDVSVWGGRPYAGPMMAGRHRRRGEGMGGVGPEGCWRDLTSAAAVAELPAVCEESGNRGAVETR